MNHYSYRVFWSDEDEAYIAVINEFSGISAWADTAQEALRELESVVDGVIAMYEREGWELPAPEPAASLVA
ncbi:MAG: type II toxin-antitoxin system HicB family antitoxin [Ardenticatenaceae bacterium]